MVLTAHGLRVFKNSKKEYVTKFLAKSGMKQKTVKSIAAESDASAKAARAAQSCANKRWKNHFVFLMACLHPRAKHETDGTTPSPEEFKEELDSML